MTIRHLPTHRHTRSRTWPRLLEPLEARTLLSAAILVTGNGMAIANHDITPSIGDFTDFGPMSTTVSAAIGQASRSFVIADTGNADLALTGGAKQIQIAGTNAKDFVLTVNSAAAIPAGMQSGFTITFVPKGAGLRKATVTILSNDPTASPFTFSIQGTGLKTTNSADGLQVATTVKGIGTAAISTTHITINYTGFLLNGTVFDTSYSPGKTPVQLTLNDPTIMQGWLEGLLGIKSGESRVLFVRAALSNGDPPHGSVPANATLIFTVNALIPVVAVSGNGVPIAFNDKTAIGADGMFIGVTPAGSVAPLTFTFKISNGSAGKVGFPALSLPAPLPVVVFTGKNAANFSASGLTFDSSFDFATFTVTYTPTTAGTQTAVAHVRTSDPVHPDFTFTVAGTSTPFLDLSPVVVGTINYPVAGNIVSGATTKYKVPLTVTNLGNTAVPGSTPPILINFYLHDTTSGTDTLFSSQAVTNLRGTGSGKSKLVNLNVAVPSAIATGGYQMRVTVNENAAVAETNFSNNSVLSPQAVGVTQGFFNVDGVLSTSTFPATIPHGLTLSGKLSVLVRNVGNLTLPAGQKFNLQVFAHPDAGADTLVGAATITLSAWAPGKTGLFAVTTKLLGGLAEGHYQLQALLAPVLPLTESSTTDNLVTANGVGGDVELRVT